MQPQIDPPVQDPVIQQRFDAAVADAKVDLRRYMRNLRGGHVVLFPDGDYVFFDGEVRRESGGAEAPPTSFAIRGMLAQRFTQTSSRLPVYGRLVPGETIEVAADALTAAAGAEDPWREALRYGDDYHVVSFKTA